MESGLAMLSFLLLIGFTIPINCEVPQVVNIGAIVTYDSVIGRVAKAAIQTAVDDINANASMLGGVRLNLIMENVNCNPFLGTVGAFRLLEKDVVAIIGPQSSATAHMVSVITNDLQIPLISFGATDPTLTSLQFPYFLRTARSDSYQMNAMVDTINYFGWNEVVAIFLDDDYGRNGISALSDAFTKKMSKVFKIPLPVGASASAISDLLSKSKMIGPRVYIVHVNPDSGLSILSAAQRLQMMTDEYVWFTTDWLSAALDSSNILYNSSVDYLQGIIGLRQHIPSSDQQMAFKSKWNNLCRQGKVTCALNVYGLFAYDTVWAVAYAINEYLNASGNITFSYREGLHHINGKMLLQKLRTFDGGSLLFQKLVLSNFAGVSGPIQFDSDRNLISSSGAYEVINIDKSMTRIIGYWTNSSGLLASNQATSNTNGREDLSVHHGVGNVTWPGGNTKKPRGWVFPNGGIPLRIGVPHRVGYVKFVLVDKTDPHNISGYCIDVFNAALKLLPYDVPHNFIPFGDGQSNPSYDELVKMVADNVFDAAVGDIAIVTNRTKIVDFTQPYIATGLVIVAPFRKSRSYTWTFLRPFTVEMWCATAGLFFLVGFVIWLLEHRVNRDFRGSPRRQFITVVLFSFSTLFKTQNENILSALGRMVMVVWLFLLMVVTSSYTASLTSFLTVQQLSSPFNGIENLIASNMPVGYQVGSYVRNYLIDNLRIKPSRLIPLGSPKAFDEALIRGPENGGVAAIIDELPYIEHFLSRTRNYGIVGPMFTKRGWGFAFPKDSPLGQDISNAILKLSENGELQRIHYQWFCQDGCVSYGRIDSDPNQLHLSSFFGLFLICAVATVAALILFILRAIHQFVQYKKAERELTLTSEASSMNCSQVIYNFFDFIDEKEEAIKNMFKRRETSSQTPTS